MNDLKSEKTSKQIAKSLINLAKEMKSNSNEVMVSSLILRKYELNEKGKKVNFDLKSLCSENNIGYVDNDFITNRHLNGSGVRLRYSGTEALGNTSK